MIEHTDVVVIEDAGRRWPVAWDAIWVGALAGLMAAVVFGLVAVGLGAQTAGVERPEPHVVPVGQTAILLLALLGIGW